MVIRCECGLIGCDGTCGSVSVRAPAPPRVPLPDRPPRKRTESTILAEIRAALAAMPDVVIFRNNVGVLKDERGIPISYGLAIGSSDLIGSLTVEAYPFVTAHDFPAGKCTRVHRIARPLAIEVKQPGKLPSPEQVKWMEHVRRAGWLVDVCCSVEDAIALVERGRAWEDGGR